MIRTDGKLSPLPALVAASAGRAGGAVRLLLDLDERLSQVAAGPGEPMLRQIRLAWWRDALSTTGAQAAGEPIIDALRAVALSERARAGLVAMVDGWEAWAVARDALTADDLNAHAGERGGGLFRAIAAAMGRDVPGDAAERAGKLWAFWDIAGRIDAPDRGSAIALARAIPMVPRRVLPMPLHILFALAHGDIRDGRGADGRFTMRHYLRVLRAQMTGR